MTLVPGIQPITLAEREAVLRWFRRWPCSTIESLASSGLYQPTRTREPRNAALCWARHHVAALRAQGLIMIVRGTGHRGDPRHFSVTCRHPFTQRVHLGNTATCLRCGLDQDVHR